jgi:hypothetical protein
MADLDWHRIQVLTLAGLILLVPVVAIAIWAIGPVWGSIVETENDADLATRFRTLVAERPAYRTALIDAQAKLRDQGELYRDASAELASADLQNAVQNLVAQAGGQTRSSEIGAPQDAHGIETIEVSLDFSLLQDRLAPLLAAIDAQKPYLIVQGLDVRATDAGDRNSALDVELTVDGFREAP